MYQRKILNKIENFILMIIVSYSTINLKEPIADKLANYRMLH